MTVASFNMTQKGDEQRKWKAFHLEKIARRRTCSSPSVNRLLGLIHTSAAPTL